MKAALESIVVQEVGQGEKAHPLVVGHVRLDDDAAPTATLRLAAEVYDRKVTQLWWEARALLVSGQLKGLDGDTCSQFCKRTYEHGKDNEGRKIKIETKAAFKSRLGYSLGPAE